MVGPLERLVSNKNCYYHISVRDCDITVERRGCNMPLESVVFSTENLCCDHKKMEAVALAYKYTFEEMGDLHNRMITVLTRDSGADTPFVHSFYYDYTSKFNETDVVLGIYVPDRLDDLYGVLRHRQGQKTYIKI